MEPSFTGNSNVYENLDPSLPSKAYDFDHIQQVGATNPTNGGVQERDSVAEHEVTDTAEGEAHAGMTQSSNAFGQNGSEHDASNVTIPANSNADQVMEDVSLNRGENGAASEPSVAQVPTYSYDTTLRFASEQGQDPSPTVDSDGLGDVNFQALLDKISESASTAPSAAALFFH